MAQIHPTALVDPGAQLHDSVSVGAYSIIGPKVRIGEGTRVGPHCVIEGRTTLGAHNHIFQFNSIGAIPQDKKYADEDTELIIGDHNTIREFCTFNLGVPAAGGLTRVGDHNWIMAYTHIAHDCVIGNHTTLANNTTLAGHVLVEDWVTVGGLVGIHQFVKIGAHSIVGFASAINQDVPPFMMVDGNPPAVRGLNSIGLKRRGFGDQRLAAIKRMHKLLYRENRTLADAQAAIEALATEFPEAAADVAHMSAFLVAAERGIVR